MAAASGVGWPRPAVRVVRVVVLALVVAVGALVGAPASPAAAHPALVSSDPADGYALATAPPAVVVRFSEPVRPAAEPLGLVGDDGARVRLVVTQEDGGAVLRGALDGRFDGALRAGAYTLRYDVVASDGDVIRGEIGFTVGLPASSRDARAAAPGVAADLAVARGLLFLGLALALGGSWAAWDAARVTGGRRGVRPLVRVGAAAGVMGAAGQVLLLADGGVGRAADMVAAGGPARLLLAEGVLLAAAAATARSPLGGRLAPAALVAVVLLEALRAHPGKVGGGMGMTLTAVHLLAASAWVGGLVHVVRLAVRWRRAPESLGPAVRSYARTALALVAVVAATGTASALLLLPSLRDVLGTPYGRTLLVKLALVLGAVALAGLARARLRRRTAGRSAVGVTAGVEVALLVSVLAATAALTSATPPRLVPTGAALAAPSGPVLRVAERARQVTVSAVIGTGRLDLRAHVPDDGRPTTYDMSAAVRTPDGVLVRPVLRGCGTACWTAEVAWPEGASELVVDVRADRWKGGRAALAVQWPAVPAPQLVAEVRDAMAAEPVIGTFETVTSGFTIDEPATVEISGREYVDAQPWAAGGATDAVAERVGERRYLLLALPALGYHFRLELDPRNRVVAERIVTPNHVLERAYTYPERS